jgi:hypothetical protein
VLWRTCWGTHWELGEHIENLMRTHWELEGNIVGTHWEPGKKGKHLECMLGPSHWLHEISLPTRVGHHFWLGLIPWPTYSHHRGTHNSMYPMQILEVKAHFSYHCHDYFIQILVYKSFYCCHWDCFNILNIKNHIIVNKRNVVDKYETICNPINRAI